MEDFYLAKDFDQEKKSERLLEVLKDDNIVCCVGGGSGGRGMVFSEHTQFTGYFGNITI